jgi:hypothetical protein
MQRNQDREDAAPAASKRQRSGDVYQLLTGLSDCFRQGESFSLTVFSVFDNLAQNELNR